MSIFLLSYLNLPFVKASHQPSRNRLGPPHIAASATMSSSAAVETPIEHMVLFKVRPEAAASDAAAAMVSSLQELGTQVPGVAYIHAGPVLRLRTPAAGALGPTHLVHARYATKADLDAYLAHPAHVAAVQGHVVPNTLDVTTIDWVNAAPSPAPIVPGNAVRLTLAKAKQGVDPAKIVEAVTASTKFAADARGVKVSFGETVSPAVAKGYHFGMVAVFENFEELEAVEGDKAVQDARVGIWRLLDERELIVLDYVLGSA